MKKELYDYQGIASNKVIWALQQFAKALMVMATGLGKTVVSASIVDYFLSRRKKSRILILCHDSGILDQLFKEYRSWFGNDCTYAKFYGKKKNWNADQHTFVFATFQSKPHLYFSASHFDYILVDEGHHAKAPTYSEVLRFFTPTWKLAMTATPDRDDLQDIRDIFGKEVVDYSLPEALAREWLTPVKYKLLTDGLDQEILQALVDEILADQIRITESQLNERIFIRARTDKQCERILEYTNTGLKAIIFCNNISHLDHVMEHLPRSVAVHSERTRSENDVAIEMYKTGLVSHIVVVDMFNEGIDLPDTDVLAFLRPTDSYRIWLQQLGRGLRKFPGKDQVVVLDFVSNIERIKNFKSLVDQIGKYTDLKGSNHNSIMDLKSPLHIEGSSFMFDFAEEIVSILSAVEYMVSSPLWATEDEIKKLYSENKWNSQKEYDEKKPANCPTSQSFPRIYGKRFGEIVYGRKKGDWVSEEEVKEIYVKNGWETYLEYDKKRPNRCPIASTFPKIYGKTFAEVMRGKKRSFNEWLTEEALREIFDSQKWKNEDEYDSNRPVNCPHSSSFPSLYKKTFGEFVHGRKFFNNWLPEEEMKNIILENGWKTTAEYNSNRPERCPHSAAFNRIYGKGFPEMIGGRKKEMSMENWLPEEDLKKVMIDKGYKNQIDYNSNRPDRAPTSTRFPQIYGKTFSEIFNGEKDRRKMGIYKTWQEASIAAKALGITTSVSYQKRYREDPKLIGDPLKYYKDLPNWKSFFAEK
jgi:superfamily II DNA or RNA helicase